MTNWAPPTRRRIYLMRHGEVDYFDPEGRPHRPEGVTLNAAGAAQAEAAGRALADIPLDRALTSGLPRAEETARAVLAGRGLTLERYPDLREIEPGRLRDLPDPQAAFLALVDGRMSPATSFLGGETYLGLQGRVLACFAGLLAEPGWTHLLIVAHGVVNRAILGEAVGAGLATLATLEQDPGCINILDVDEAGRLLVRLVNHTPANPLKDGPRHTTMESLYLQFSRGKGTP